MASMWAPPAAAKPLNPSDALRPPGRRTSAVAAGTDFQHARVLYPRPAEVSWSRELANTVHLMSVVGSPIQIKQLSSGKVLAWTRLAVKKSATDTAWHPTRNVVVQQLNFVEKSFPVSSFDPDSSATSLGVTKGNGHSDQGRSSEELWQAFFANPIEWWDNRKNQRSPNYPDFKHKHTGEALWVDARYNPPWIKSQLDVLDSKMENFHANERNRPATFFSGDDFAPF